MSEINDAEFKVLMDWRQEAIDSLKSGELEPEDQALWGHRASALSKLLSSGWPKSAPAVDARMVVEAVNDAGDLIANARARAATHYFNVDDWEITWDDITDLSDEEPLSQPGGVMRIGLLADAGVIYATTIVTGWSDSGFPEDFDIALYEDQEQAHAVAAETRAEITNRTNAPA